MLIIGESLNATRQQVRAAVQNYDVSFIQALAQEQSAAGADMLDVNAAVPGQKEVEDLPWMVQTVQQHPCRIIILSFYDDDAYLTQAAKAGVWGYLLKSASSEVLADAIRTVYRGEKCLSPALAGKALEQLEQANKQWLQAKSGLTEQELRLLELIADGASVQEMAEA